MSLSARGRNEEGVSQAVEENKEWERFWKLMSFHYNRIDSRDALPSAPEPEGTSQLRRGGFTHTLTKCDSMSLQMLSWKMSWR